MHIKICGLTNFMDAEAATLAGATDLGFVMGGWVQPAEIEPHAQKVREIIRKLPQPVDTLIVTHLFDGKDIVDLADYVGSTGMQISERVPLETLQYVKTYSNKKIIKTIVVDPVTGFQDMEIYAPYSDFYLLDTRNGGYIGGTGEISDWDLCAELVARSPKPVYLAGGLNAQNVIEGIETVQPQGVDISTGVSCYSDHFQRKDRKDRQKIHQFISLVNEHCREYTKQTA